jgi:hypothetical protein
MRALTQKAKTPLVLGFHVAACGSFELETKAKGALMLVIAATLDGLIVAPLISECQSFCSYAP